MRIITVSDVPMRRYSPTSVYNYNIDPPELQGLFRTFSHIFSARGRRSCDSGGICKEQNGLAAAVFTALSPFFVGICKFYAAFFFLRQLQKYNSIIGVIVSAAPTALIGAVPLPPAEGSVIAGVFTTISESVAVGSASFLLKI